LRAIRILEKVDFLLCEDTRVTSALLNKLKIKNRPRLISYYKEVEAQKISEVVEILQKGKLVALVSDAGSPLISDPGWLLVKTCISLDLEIEALPGANAILPAWQLSGLPAGNFAFLGFLPKKKNEKLKVLGSLSGITKIAYESPERILETIEMFDSKTKIAVCMELTKMYQKIYSFSFTQTIISNNQIKNQYQKQQSHQIRI
jgi:16S rRNA (cytidine1402-2'-O)-methyltransferase